MIITVFSSLQLRNWGSGKKTDSPGIWIMDELCNLALTVCCRGRPHLIQYIIFPFCCLPGTRDRGTLWLSGATEMDKAALPLSNRVAKNDEWRSTAKAMTKKRSWEIGKRGKRGAKALCGRLQAAGPAPHPWLQEQWMLMAERNCPWLGGSRFAQGEAPPQGKPESRDWVNSEQQTLSPCSEVVAQPLKGHPV